MSFDPESWGAIELAKRALREGGRLDAAGLAAALCHCTRLATVVPDLAAVLVAPPPLVEEVGKRPLAEEVQPVMSRLFHQPTPASPATVLEQLLRDDACRSALGQRGVPASIIDHALATLEQSRSLGADPRPAMRPSDRGPARPVHKDPEPELRRYGRLIEPVNRPYRAMDVREGLLASLITTLCGRNRRSAIVVGPPGTGKSALIQELAWRTASGHESIPRQLRGTEFFELSPSFLHSGASLVEQYQRRLRTLSEMLQSRPNTVLFIDEIHALFENDTYHKRPFADATSSLKQKLQSGEIACVGCTNPAMHHQHIKPDDTLAPVFETLVLEPTSRQQTVRVLEARCSRTKHHFGVTIPHEILERTAEMADDWLPARYQPDKSIRLLDRACVLRSRKQSENAAVTEDDLARALEDMVGRPLLRTRTLTTEQVRARLCKKLFGHDKLFKELARKVVAGLGGWKTRSGPRGVFLFAGPTGVGKTQAAVLLSEILDEQGDSLVRVDCNTLQGTALDDTALKNRLFGPPPGYVGYRYGEGGLLFKVREIPEPVVLLDEFEKAPPTLGSVLLQIVGEGRTFDQDGKEIDFRRAFIILTTNAGASRKTGFHSGKGRDPRTMHVEQADVFSALKAGGVDDTFLGRLHGTFIFQVPDAAAMHKVVNTTLERLQGDAKQTMGAELSWDPALVEELVAQWEPRFGVRHLTKLLNNRIVEQMNLADADGNLGGVGKIEIKRWSEDDSGEDAIWGSEYRKRGSTLEILIR